MPEIYIKVYWSVKCLLNLITNVNTHFRPLKDGMLRYIMLHNRFLCIVIRLLITTLGTYDLNINPLEQFVLEYNKIVWPRRYAI